MVPGNHLRKVNVRHRQQVFSSIKQDLRVQSSYDTEQF